MTVAANPCPAGIFSWKNRTSTAEIKTLRRKRVRVGEFFVAIHAGDVAVFGWDEGQSAHVQSATGNSTARLENASQSLKTAHNPAGRFPL